MKMISVDAVRPRIRTKDILLTVAFTALTIAAARFSFKLPFTPVLITLQTLTVILAGMVLGSRLGALSQVQYMVIGLAGAPVFSLGIGGPAALLTPSFGYVPGFILAAFLSGWAWEKLGRKGLLNAAISAAMGACAIYLIGVPWLSIFFMITTGKPAEWCATQAVMAGMAPFLGVDACKVAIAATIVAGSRARR
jgi:biotin transport system substrate-specific component